MSQSSASFDPTDKIFSRSDAVAWRRACAGRVVFTNGVFDLLHGGHVDVLRAARLRGDALIVGVNSDASVRRLKGADRPIRSAAERAYLLAALAAVDAVCVFDEDTPRELIVELRPDVLVKGGDYTVGTMIGASEVMGWGGEAIVVPLTAGQSTTELLERLRGGS
ncbi:MAG: D-glycero-beta-D-manno-heptose 1-phosphate adenylyltransferase [Gemmatimonadaceae bacterium]